MDSDFYPRISGQARPRRGDNFILPPPVNFDSFEMRGSIQKIMMENTGKFVVIDFLIGTETLVQKKGILYFVGEGYVVLYDVDKQTYTICDLYAIKFTTFFDAGERRE